MAMSAQASIKSSIPIFYTVSSFHEWRENVRKQGKSVGYVATMGALHQGHLSLVERSLRDNDLTIVSIFVNPAQFASNEDLGSYPRTLPNDISELTAVSVPSTSPGSSSRTTDAIFAPSVMEMYPNGLTRDVASQKGTFIEVKGYSHQMEGRSRPHFFRGVATVVTKLFNVIQPTNTYFGQKDIQQALLLRRLCADLLLSHPKPQNLHIVPTARDPSGLALSSRNKYLSERELPFAASLYQALEVGEKAWEAGFGRDEVIKRATETVLRRKEEAEVSQVELRLDYVEMNDPETFEVMGDESRGCPAILSGALWIGKTRLIDNILLGSHTGILSA